MILDKAHLVTTPSQFLKDKILAVYPKYPPEKIVVIPNGIDLSLYSPQTKRPYILSSGRLLTSKGFQNLIAAATDLDLGWEVHIVGDGVCREALETQARLVSVPIHFHGWIDNRSTLYKDLMEQASIFVLMSEVESFGMVVAEAMSAGCAVVVRAGTGAAELVGDGGVLVENTATLAVVLRQLVSDEQLRTKRQNRARSRIAAFSWEKVTEKYATHL
jgi:glycosyltransferase involved in cell wall biosynthesis